MRNDNCILTIISRSSSIKFSLYKFIEPLEQLFNGESENIRSKKTVLSFGNVANLQKNRFKIEASDHEVHGYKDEGSVTTSFDMEVQNEPDRFHLVIDVINRLPQTGDKRNLSEVRASE